MSLWTLAPLYAARKKSKPPEPPPIRATQPPVFSIPVEPLGFSAPGEFYLGARNSLVSLDFLDENHLLFTFRVPGLIRRDVHNEDARNERRIRAVVLALPQGTVDAETLWTVHDRDRYLYMLDNGRFLFRDRNELKRGDASLDLKPFLRFPGPLLWVEHDPSRSFLVTGSAEPPTAASDANVGSPATARASVTTDAPAPDGEDLILRILRRDTGKIMLVSHIRAKIHVPLNDEGYVDTLRGEGKNWLLNLDHFTGGNTVLGKVESTCTPLIHFISTREFLATTCDSAGDPHLVAMTTAGKKLWDTQPVGPAVWPLLVMNEDGSRLARETLLASHEVNASAPIGTEDIRGQDVAVYDAVTGKLVLRAAASPIFDAGGNVAISPSGRRVAIIMNSAIQVFELPPAPPLPPFGDSHTKR